MLGKVKRAGMTGDRGDFEGTDDSLELVNVKM